MMLNFVLTALNVLSASGLRMQGEKSKVLQPSQILTPLNLWYRPSHLAGDVEIFNLCDEDCGTAVLWLRDGHIIANNMNNETIRLSNPRRVVLNYQNYQKSCLLEVQTHSADSEGQLVGNFNYNNVIGGSFKNDEFRERGFLPCGDTPTRAKVVNTDKIAVLGFHVHSKGTDTDGFDAQCEWDKLSTAECGVFPPDAADVCIEKPMQHDNITNEVILKSHKCDNYHNKWLKPKKNEVSLKETVADKTRSAIFAFDGLMTLGEMVFDSGAEVVEGSESVAAEESGGVDAFVNPRLTTAQRMRAFAAADGDVDETALESRSQQLQDAQEARIARANAERQANIDRYNARQQYTSMRPPRGGH